MNSVEIAKLLRIPKERFRSFKTILSNMKYSEKLLLEDTHYIVSRGKIDYTDEAIPIIRERVRNILKRPKFDYSKYQRKSLDEANSIE